MKIPVRELLETHTSAEITEWMAFDAINPIDGIARLEMMFANLTCITMNINRKRGKAAFKPKQFIPEYGPQVQQSPEKMKQIFEMLVEATGGKVVKRKNKRPPRKRKHNNN